MLSRHHLHAPLQHHCHAATALLSALVGIYYTPGSLKAKLCIDGRQRLYKYCDSHKVPYSKLGKLLVAAHDDQIPKLKGFLANGKKNGMTDLEWLEGPAAKQLEPDLNCVAAIRSPSTGVISSVKLACSPLMLHLLDKAHFAITQSAQAVQPLAIIFPDASCFT